MEVKSDTLKLALIKAQNWCSRREYSRREVRDKLLRSGYAEEVIQQVIQELVTEKFIDESRLAGAYVRDKSGLMGWGPAKIRYGLMKKGISADVIAENLLLVSAADQYEKALDLGNRKLKNIKGENNWQIKGKLIRFLAGRGFSLETACRVADALIGD
jgi:regulatory protein